MTHFVVWCQGGPASGFRYETCIEPDDEIALISVPIGDKVHWMRQIIEVPQWPKSTVYVRVRSVEQIDGECIYYPKGSASGA